MAKNKVVTEYTAKGNHKEYLDGLIKKQKDYAGKLNSSVKSFTSGKKAALGYAAAALAVGKGIQASVKEFATFEKQMSTVKALLKPTAGEFDTLSAKARDLGKSTAFSAQQAAEAFTELGKLGFEANEIVASSADVLNLAAAANTNMATSAEVTAKTLNQFNLEAEEAARVTDVIAKASSSSAVDIYNFKEAMKIAGGVASGFGVSLEDTTAAVSALADAGLEGTMAGTGLSRMLVEMEKTGSKANELMQRLGATTDPLPEKLRKMKAAGLSTSQIIDTFGQIAGKSAIALINNADKVDELADAYENASGAAKEMADTQLDNLDGSTKLLASAFSELKITIGETFAPSARGLIDLTTKAITGMTTALNAAEWVLDSVIDKLTGAEGADKRGEFMQSEGDIHRVIAAMKKLEETKDQYDARGFFTGNREQWKLLQEEIKKASGYQVENLNSLQELKVAGQTVEQLTAQMERLAEARMAAIGAGDGSEAAAPAEAPTGGGGGGQDSDAAKARLEERLEAVKALRAAHISLMAAEDAEKQKVKDSYAEALNNAQLTADEIVLIEQAKNAELQAVTDEYAAQREAREKDLSMALLDEEDRRVQEVRDKWAGLLADDVATKDQRIEAERVMREEIDAIEEEYAEKRRAREEEEHARQLQAQAEKVAAFTRGQDFVTNIFKTGANIRAGTVDKNLAKEIDAINRSTKSAEEKEKAIEKAEKKAAAARHAIAVKEWRQNVLAATANTAVAVTKALAAAPFPANLPLAAGAGAAGAVEIAGVTASKPRFARGSRDAFGGFREIGNLPGSGGGVDSQLGLFTPGEVIIPPGPDAERAKAAVNGGGTGATYHVTVAPVYHIGAGASEDMIAMLEPQNAELQQIIVETIENAKTANKFDPSRVSI